MRAAIYARYSTDLQSAASVEDQIRLCAEREGWSVVRQDDDRGISGASMLRPGLQAMLQGAARGEFDVLIAEASTGSRATRRTSPASTSGSALPASAS